MSETPSTIPPRSSSDDNILHDFYPCFKAYKDGRVERHAFHYQPPHPTGFDPQTGIETKDIVISPETGVTVRLFVSKLENPGRKLPLIFHIHGGGFSIGSARDAITYNFAASLLSRVDAIMVSVEYRLAPEHPLPTAYEDSWEALKWVELHSTGSGPEPVLNRVVDFDKVFLIGESAGANIEQHLAVRTGVEGLALRIAGMIVVHPFFVGDEVDEHYKFMCPTSSGGKDDPRLFPGADPNLARMGTSRVLVCVAEKDFLKERGLEYCETLKRSGWVGSVELFESQGCDHCFHMFSKEDRAMELIQKFADFVKLA